MTAQIPEKFTNRVPSVDFSGYELFSICVSDPADYKNYKGYPFKQKGDPDKCITCSSCWRGYVSVYELTSAGEIVLIKFEYPYGRTPREPDDASEVLKGDFWLQFRTEFFGDKLFVPFKNGMLVTDKNEWIKFERT